MKPIETKAGSSPRFRKAAFRQPGLIALVVGLTAVLLAGEVWAAGLTAPPNLKADLSAAIAALRDLPVPPGPTVRPEEAAKPHPRMAARLRHRIDRKAAERARAGKTPLSAESRNIRVMLQLRQGTAFDPATIAADGGRVLRNKSGLVTAELPFDRIESVVDGSPAIALARLPHRFRALGEGTRDTSEGVAITGAADFHASGFRGAGVKIAVIDVGFLGLSDAQARGDLPTNLFTHDFTGEGLQRHLKHGTGCAEIVYDVAPDAELHLLRIKDEQDIYDAFDYCIAHGIHIVSLSIGTSGSGPGNGTGPFESICDEARAAGILVVAAAGNESNSVAQDGTPMGTHWEGVFTDINNDFWHEFSPGRSANLIMAYPDKDDEGVPDDDEVTIAMRWDDWPYSSVDYDMVLNQYDSAKDSYIWVASAENYQTGTQEPVEEIVLDVPDNVTYRIYALYVPRMEDAPAGRKLEIFLSGRSHFFGVPGQGFPLLATSMGSIVEPADAASVLAVGAIDYTKWNSGTIEDFSSQGPTNDWAGRAAMIKPDIVGPDGVTTFAYTHPFLPDDEPSQFFGTSASTPHVAGAAALVKSLHPNKGPAELQAFLQSWATGTSGKDNVYGYGRLRLSLANSPPVFSPATISKTVGEGQLLSFSVSATDADRDTLTYDASSLPQGARFNPATRIFSWRPTYCQGGQSYQVTFRATDGTAPAPNDEGYASATIRVDDVPPRGDLDASCTADLADAVLALQVLAGFDVSGSLRRDYAASGADVSGDTVVGFPELLYIVQTMADLR